MDKESLYHHHWECTFTLSYTPGKTERFLIGEQSISEKGSPGRCPPVSPTDKDHWRLLWLFLIKNLLRYTRGLPGAQVACMGVE